jgi:hypothetical protein
MAEAFKHQSADPLVSAPLPDRSGGERALWCAVLLTHFLDVTNTYRSASAAREKEDAIRWIGSRGFRDVCMLAGIDPQYAESRFREAVASPKAVKIQKRAA